MQIETDKFSKFWQNWWTCLPARKKQCKRDITKSRGSKARKHYANRWNWNFKKSSARKTLSHHKSCFLFLLMMRFSLFWIIHIYKVTRNKITIFKKALNHVFEVVQTQCEVVQDPEKLHKTQNVTVNSKI